MSKQVYDLIAQQYKESKQKDFRKYIEAYTLFKLSGEVTNLHILDLACGEGIYTRKIKERGAATILGVDISPEMIKLALEEENKKALGCAYLIKDVIGMGKLGDYDLALGMYILNYARSKAELLEMCTSAYINLKPGGRFIGFNDNPMNQVQHYVDYYKYGFIKETTPTREEGDYIRYVMTNPDGSTFHFNNYYLHPSTYEACFAEAGFKDFKWEGPYLHESQKDNLFWTDFFQDPPLVGFSARK